MIYRSLIYIVLLVSISTSLWAQQPKKLSWNDQFILDKSGKPFPVQDSFVTLNGKVYDFRKSIHPAFVYISSESCLPCKFELPLYMEACKQYPDFDFVYFTTDQDTMAVKNKFGKQFNIPNLYIVSRPYDYFYEHQLMLGFPTKYFINGKQKVETVQLGGYMVKEKVLEEWLPVLTHLQ
jgi:thiol-disulfide isomerase/thioredoxin